MWVWIIFVYIYVCISDYYKASNLFKEGVLIIIQFHIWNLQNAGEESVANLDKIKHNNGKITTADLRLKMQKTMQGHAAVFRDGPILQKGCEKMKEIYKEFQDVKVIDK